MVTVATQDKPAVERLSAMIAEHLTNRFGQMEVFVWYAEELAQFNQIADVEAVKWVLSTWFSYRRDGYPVWLDTLSSDISPSSYHKQVCLAIEV